jgi:hypothetical protein
MSLSLPSLSGRYTSRVNPRLKTLHIHQGDDAGYLPPSERPTPVSKYTATFATLSPLLSLPGLSDLGIMVDTQFSLNDDDAWKMARAWPRLKQLEMGIGGNGWGRGGEVLTLEGLRAFATHCPYLQELSVAVHIGETALEPCKGPEIEQAEKTHDKGDMAVARCHGLQYLEVGDSIYRGDPERIAMSLLDIFPRLRGVSGPNIAVSPEWEKKWMQVSELVNEIQRSSHHS